ncbi:beta-galactosidase [Dictyobacter kobayashii]|uniref:Beta-galactosidase n=1 Tax=Dictyobacter kobayashii TaxID=2014872 RepID=A0A402AZA8_9CHLR|nr:beta-galactosidase [Dictyobacter kobayashii]GCE24418.1 beta-galactosidase [Dictyobacter kobayashii]
MQQLGKLRFPVAFYGGDYNPEQWMAEENGRQVWLEDLRLMRKAGVNLVSLGVFSWAALQPAEDRFVFEWLDQILELLAAQQIFVCLGTATAAQPAWLSAAYPDVLPVDEAGVRHKPGVRLNYCPTNEQFRRLSQNLVRKLAERYREHSALLLWHVSNEYGPACYCEYCAMRFRGWLQQRYGSLEELNRRWITTIWSRTYTSWEQVQPPSSIGEHSLQALQLDYQRFLSDMNLEGYLGEAAILREVTPHIPVMTNFHGLTRHMDYFSWAPHQDIISWDSYPRHNSTPDMVAFFYDMMRCLKHNQPWLLLEQTPSQVQWHQENPLKRPGVMRLQSYQALAHGSNAIMFFQWRQARGGREMYHGAMVSHAGHEQTRIFQEVAALGAELKLLEPALLETQMQARVALLMSWPNWWAVENRHTPSRHFNYIAELQHYYRALWQRNIAVDIISPDQALDNYQLVIAPLFTMVSEEQGAAIEQYVKEGGTFLTTYFSGMIDESHRAWLGGFPGPLRRTLGIWVEEFDPLPEGKTNTLFCLQEADDWSGSYSCERWCDIVHLEGAQTLAVFGQDFYAGRPAITENHYGLGQAFYVATRPEAAGIDALINMLQSRLGLTAPLLVPRGVEVTRREGKITAYFLLNHLPQEQYVSLPRPMRDVLTQQVYEQEMQLPPHGVAILIPLYQ